MLLLIGLIFGIYIGYKANDIIKKLQNGIDIRIKSYQFTFGKIEKAPVVPIKSQHKENTPKKKPKCKTCNNEDIFIKGTKNLIPCPECKRNAGKFKNVL